MPASAAESAVPIPVVESGAQQPQATAFQAPSAVESGSAAGPEMLLNQIGSLQQEVMELRGLLEEQTAAIEQIKKDHRDRYLDLDRRLSALDAALRKRPAGSASVSVAPVTTPQAPVADTSGAALPVNEQAGNALYQATFQQIRERKFDKAVSGLRLYLENYPRGGYADNAQYWLGEVYLAQNNYSGSEQAFKSLLETFPKSDKRADATYKLGQVYDRQGKQDQARVWLKKAVKDFPGTTAARLADLYLNKLGR